MSLALATEHSLRVVVAEPHEGFRRALGLVLAQDPRVTVVAAVENLDAAGSAVRARSADVVVVAAALARRGLERLGPVEAGTKVVVVGMDDTKGLTDWAQAHGASAYLVKDLAHVGLVDHVLSVGAR